MNPAFEIYAKVRAAIRIPPGIAWESPAFEAVKEPETRFLKLLYRLEDGESDVREALQQAGNEFVLAWRRAVKVAA